MIKELHKRKLYYKIALYLKNLIVNNLHNKNTI